MDTGKNPDRNKKLIYLSRKVLDRLQTCSSTTGNSIAKDIINELPSSLSDTDFKNVQRRVYDALNVLHALDIVSKVRNEIRFQGRVNWRDMKELSAKISVKREAAVCKLHKLTELFLHLTALHSLVSRNMQLTEAKPKVYLPCLVIKLSSKFSVNLSSEQAQLRTEQPAELINDTQLLSRLGLHLSPTLSDSIPKQLVGSLLGKSGRVTCEESSDFESDCH
jgi:hypothetical protein